MAEVLVIGYGNSLRGDDGVGCYIAECLSERLAAAANILTAHQLYPEMAEPISRVDFVLFIDACVGEKPGEVAYQQVDPAPQSSAFLHRCDPGQLLLAARQLYGASPAAGLITIAGQSFDFYEGLSETVQAVLPTLIGNIERFIVNYGGSSEISVLLAEE